MSKKYITFMIAVLLCFTALVTPASASGKGDQIVAIAKKYIGVPYKWGGTTPSGFDCSGFTTYVFKEAGVTSIPRTAQQQYNSGTAVSKANLQPGDMVFFKNTYNKAGITHAGIYVGGNQFISAVSNGVKIDSLGSSYWGPKYVGAKRFVKDEPAPAPKPAALPKLPVGEYHDLPKDYWAYNEVTQLSKAGIINGYEQSLFKPERDVKRSEAAKMLATALNLAPKQTTAFGDVSAGHWANAYIGAVAEAGVMQGKGEGKFDPDQSITRAEIAAMITRAFNLEANGETVNLSDIDGHWAQEEIVIAASNNIATGYKNETFKPDEKANRATVAVFVHRAIQ